MRRKVRPSWSLSPPRVFGSPRRASIIPLFIQHHLGHKPGYDTKTPDRIEKTWIIIPALHWPAVWLSARHLTSVCEVLHRFQGPTWPAYLSSSSHTHLPCSLHSSPAGFLRNLQRAPPGPAFMTLSCCFLSLMLLPQIYSSGVCKMSLLKETFLNHSAHEPLFLSFTITLFTIADCSS